VKLYLQDKEVAGPAMLLSWRLIAFVPRRPLWLCAPADRLLTQSALQPSPPPQPAPPPTSDVTAPSCSPSPVMYLRTMSAMYCYASSLLETKQIADAPFAWNTSPGTLPPMWLKGCLSTMFAVHSHANPRLQSSLSAATALRPPHSPCKRLPSQTPRHCQRVLHV
jgi:hypothetical protein